MSKNFLLAFQGKNPIIPVWMMRQAGRYLPEYQTIRKKHTLEEMFCNPKIASEVTLQPIRRYQMDAAILFADILTLPKAMGADIYFDNQKGPVIDTHSAKALKDIQSIDYIADTIHLVKKNLNDQTALIGFAGSPFTVLTYLCEGGSSIAFKKTFAFMYQDSKGFHDLMNILTKNTIAYLKQQEEAGIEAFQLFDSWAGILSDEDYRRFVLPYVKEIFEAFDLPSIYYLRASGHLLKSADETTADFLSVCHTVDLKTHPVIQTTQKGIQGNLFQALLYASDDMLLEEVDRLLQKVSHFKRYIFNLGHGMWPDFNPSKVELIVKRVREFSCQKT